MLLLVAMDVASPVRLLCIPWDRCILTRLQALLRAIADKLIPGIFDVQRIALLQQTEALDGVKPSGEGVETLSTLQHVIERATSKEVVEREIKSTTTSFPMTMP
jgi:hypothetical protein